MNRPTRKPRPGEVAAHLAALSKFAESVRPGSNNLVEVRHYVECDLLNERGPCNCKPIIVAMLPP